MPPSFGITYFVSKLFLAAFKAIPRTLCTRLTPYSWVKLFFALGLFSFVCANSMRRFTFCLFTYPDWAINITPWLCIGNKSPLATAPSSFRKNPRSSCSNGGHQALRRGSFRCPSGDPPSLGVSSSSFIPNRYILAWF